jgi:formate dehydrogenase subunit gamma
MIKRHSKSAIFLHWFNAICWFFLLTTGFALIQNKDLALLGDTWSRWMRSLFGSAETMLTAHITVGALWACVFFLFGLLGFRSLVIPFVKEILSFSLGRDLTWLTKKGIQMTLGEKVLEKRGIDPTLPDQGFYNAGQKLFAVPSLFGGVLIGLTGVILALSNVWFTETSIVQWAIFVHFLCVGLVFAGLLIHIYMAAVAPGERPAFISMFTGHIPKDHARHHHRLWIDKVDREADPE